MLLKNKFGKNKPGKNKSGESLKKGFLKRFFWGALIVWLTVGLASYLSTRNELDELYDGEMEQIAQVLLGLYSSQDTDLGQETQVASSPFEGDADYEDKLVFQVWDKKGHLLVRSANAPLEPLAEGNGVYRTRDVYGNSVRTLSIKGPEGRLIVHVGQNIEVRRENAAEALAWMMYILLFGFPVLLWLINRGINRGTDSLNDLSEKIARRSDRDLSPVETKDTPLEIRGIVNALNKLILQLGEMLERERRFISDASHELRTPLSGIRAHAQLALKDKNHEHNSLLKIIEGVDRTTRLANQLLTLSGVEAMGELETSGTIDVEALLHTVITDLNTETSAKSIQIHARFDTQDTLNGSQDLLYILLRNLIENAVRYSPPSSDIEVSYQRSPEGLTVSVVDQGPGISPDQHERVFDRFYRDVNVQGRGSGLGLAISRQIASLHHAEIVLEAAKTGSGLKVKVVFPGDG